MTTRKSRTPGSASAATRSLHASASWTRPSRAASAARFDAKLTTFAFAVARTIDFWKSRDKCQPKETATKVGADTTCRAYSCSRDVTLCLIEGGGHGWPGKPALGWQQKMDVYITQSFDATAEAWKFFEAHPKP